MVGKIEPSAKLCVFADVVWIELGLAFLPASKQKLPAKQLFPCYDKNFMS